MVLGLQSADVALNNYFTLALTGEKFVYVWLCVEAPVVVEAASLISTERSPQIIISTLVIEKP